MNTSKKPNPWSDIILQDHAHQSICAPSILHYTNIANFTAIPNTQSAGRNSYPTGWMQYKMKEQKSPSLVIDSVIKGEFIDLNDFLLPITVTTYCVELESVLDGSFKHLYRYQA